MDDTAHDTGKAVSDYLKSAKDIESDFHRRALNEIQRNISTMDTRKNNLLNLYLDGKIDDATYNAKRIELNETLDELHKKENLHRTADDNVNDTIINLFRAAQHISDNFIKSSEVATKRTILKSIFRTLQLKDTTLCYDLNFPFNVLYKNTENNKWRGMNTVRFHTYKFQFYREFTGIFPL